MDTSIPAGESALRSLASAQVAPVVEAVAIFFPAVADVSAVVHVRDEDVLDARVDLRLRLLHRLPGSDDNQDDAGRTGNEPLAIDLLDVFDVHFVGGRLLENNRGIFGEGLEGFVVVKGKRRHNDPHADLKAAAHLQFGVHAARQIPEELPDRRDHSRLLNADRGVTESCSEFERINAIVVDDAVQVDVADVAFLGQLRFHLEQGLIEQVIRPAPEHGSAHFAGGRTNVAGEELLVLEIDVDGIDEVFAVEKGAYRHFHADHEPLELENLDFVGKSSFVGFQHANDVLAVVFFSDEKAAFDVLRFAAGFDDVTAGILRDVLDGVVEGFKFAVGNDIDARLFQFFLAKRAVIFEFVAVGSTADYQFSASAQRLRLFALTQGVVEDDDVGPLLVLLPILGLRDEAVGDIAFLLVGDKIADFVALLGHLPGDVADQAGERYKQEILFVHCASRAMLSNSGREIVHELTYRKMMQFG